MDKPNGASRTHVFFIVGAILSVCGLTPLIFYLFGFAHPLFLLLPLVLGIILFIIGLIKRDEEFINF